MMHSKADNVRVVITIVSIGEHFVAEGNLLVRVELNWKAIKWKSKSLSVVEWEYN